MTDAMKRQIETELADLNKRLMELSSIMKCSMHLESTFSYGNTFGLVSVFHYNEDETMIALQHARLDEGENEYIGLLDQPLDWHLTQAELDKRKKEGEDG